MSRGTWSAVLVSVLLAGVAEAQAPAPEVVLPAIPTGAVCAEEKTRLIERALDASRIATENAQAATRLMLERQADVAARRAEPAALEAARAERARRNADLARAEAAFDAANRLSERDCRPEAQQRAATPPADGATPPRVALSLGLTTRATARRGRPAPSRSRSRTAARTRWRARSWPRSGSVSRAAGSPP